MKDFRNNIGKSVGLMFVVQLMNYVVPLLTLPFLSSVLSEGSFSEYIFILVVIQSTYMLSEFGVNIFATNKLVHANDAQGEQAAKINGGVFLLKIFVVTVAMIGVSIIVLNFTTSGYGIVLLVYGIVLFYSLVPQWLFMAVGEVPKFAIATLCGKIVFLLLTFTFISDDSDFLLLFVILLISNAICLSIAFYYYIQVCYRFPVFIYSDFLNLMKISIPYVAGRIANLIPLNGPVLILGALHSPLAILVFSSIDQLGRAGRGLGGAVVMAVYPFVLKERVELVFFKIFMLFLLLTSLSCVVISFYSSEIMTLIFNIQDPAIDSLFILFLLLVVFSFVSQMFGFPMFSLIDRADIVNMTSYIQLAFFLIGLVLIWGEGVVHMAILMVATEFFLCVIRLFTYQRCKKNLI
jgi:O-antigen/teichoic acid export membrane protein